MSPCAFRVTERPSFAVTVVFVEGMARKGTHYLFYYGAADKYVGVAEVPIIH